MADPYDKESGVTVGELIRQLKSFNPEDPVSFGGHGQFTFYRVKDRGAIAHIEFNEALGVDYDLLPPHHYMQHLAKIGLNKK